jgi:hypothetical protein
MPRPRKIRRGPHVSLLRAFGVSARIAAAVAVLLLVATSAPAYALEWRGTDLAAQGIHKGAGLPLFGGYIDGLHSSFATQELSKTTPPWTLFAGSYNQYYYADTLRDENGNNVPGRYRLSQYLLVERLILLTPLRTDKVQHFLEAIPTFVAFDYSIGSVARSTAALGDFAVGSGFNFPEIYDDGALKIEGLVDVDVFLPTGHYHPGGLRNVSFDTYSYLWSNDLIFHLRSIGNGIFFEPSLYFAGSSENDRFKNPLTSEITSYSLGPTMQALFKLLYHLNPEKTLNAGIEGFFDFQYRDDRMGGSRIHDSAEQGRMLGGIVSGVFAGFLIDVSVVREFDAKNRPEGTRFSAIVYRVFGPPAAASR